MLIFILCDVSNSIHVKEMILFSVAFSSVRPVYKDGISASLVDIHKH